MVIETDRNVYKLPSWRYGWRYFLKGLLANIQEVTVSGWHAGRPDGFVCPVLRSLPGGWLVVMPRLRVMSEEEWREFDREGFERECGYEVGDLKPDNLGWLDGRWVWIDYGS